MNEHTHIEDLTSRIKPRTASNVLLFVVVGFFVIFVIWAALTELDRTVRGQGRVVATSQLQVVSNLEGGVIEAIEVRTGQQVKAGQELIRLDRTATGAELGSGEASANALGMKIARLSAEVAGREPSYPAPADAAAASQLMIERSLHASRMQELGSLASAGQARVAQASRAVQEARAAYDARVTARDARRDELNLIRPMVERGLEPRLSLMQAESAFSVAASEAASAAAAIARAGSAVVEAQSALNQQRQDWRSVAANELATAQAEYSARSATLPALAERSARTTVRAPLPGRVNRVLVTTVGSAVGPGAPLVEIVPSEETLIVQAMVRPQDIAWVHMGQKARVNITAYDSSIYGSLYGAVIAISPDATVNEKTGESFYTVQVRTTKNALIRYGHPLPIGTGMIADVSLLGDKRTVLSYLLNPITKLSQTAFRE
ncbi:MAG: rane fusion protein adhesin transport system [Sphingomonadales bacterium]|jgi:adhesin transport system membrane fusion protein|nr:rane fusion protein adhesin transport system [Sphingomonadales bacterium]